MNREKKSYAVIPVNGIVSVLANGVLTNVPNSGFWSFGGQNESGDEDCVLDAVCDNLSVDVSCLHN